MKSIKLGLLCTLGAALFTGCETTGNPREGGIFWSERKAQDRIDEREDRLDVIEGDTRRVQRRNRQLRSEL